MDHTYIWVSRISPILSTAVCTYSIANVVNIVFSLMTIHFPFDYSTGSKNDSALKNNESEGFILFLTCF
jgi:hypothetical protein